MPQLMVLGTTSDAGKSTLVAAICRSLARKHVRVAPFKPQNMALNSAVTEDGGEIGRAQALQAQACYLSPHTDMNPILIKPSSDTGAQIIVQGKALSDMEAAQFHDYKKSAMEFVLQSFDRLQAKYQSVVIEGAGSPAEINLRRGDIANMGFAEAVDCPCVLIADIDRGGVFAHIVGTLDLLSESEQKRIVGFVINRFRGDIALLQSGLDWLEQRTGKPVIAVLPYLHSFYLDSEDAITTQQNIATKKLKVVVPVLPHISNHTDFDALRLNPEVDLVFCDVTRPMPGCDLIILPGSKNVRQDLQTLKDYNWPKQIKRHLRYGGKLFGICGGYQMLGQTISDPLGVEGAPGQSVGLDLLPIKTEYAQEKTTTDVQALLLLGEQTVELKGYEIHHGFSHFTTERKPLIKHKNGEVEGCVSDDNLVAGSYCHGIFDEAQPCQALLQWCGCSAEIEPSVNEIRERQLTRLADVLDDSFSWNKLNNALRSNGYESFPV